MRTRIRRGGIGRNRNNKNSLNLLDKWSIYHSNIRGFDSKRISLETILETVRPNIVTLNETHFMNKKKLNLEGYVTFQRNRSNVKGGGVATAICQNESNRVMKVKEGVDKDEFVITRHSQFKVPINIINVYGETESRDKNEAIEDRWHRIVTELKRIELNGENVILIGDMNKHVGDIVPGNHKKISYGGSLVKELVNTKKYTLVNSMAKVKGGPFTRYNPANPSDDKYKSCIDLIIMNKELAKYVDEVVIDKELKFTPGRPLPGKRLCHTDHYGILLVLKSIPLASQKNTLPRKYKMWNLKKEGGWQYYKELSENNDNLKKIAKDYTNNPTVLMDKIEKEMKKVKFKAFGKVSVRNNLRSNKDLKSLQKQKLSLNLASDSHEIMKIDEEITRKLISSQSQRLEKEIADIKDTKTRKGKTAAIFKLKEKIIGTKKSAQEAILMKDPDTNAELASNKEVKEASLKYCVKLLSNRAPKKGYVDGLDLIDRVHEARMEEKIENDVSFSEEIFESSLKDLKLKNKEKYEFILKGGQDLKHALFTLFNLVWKCEEKPEQWRKTVIVQLYKGKGELDQFSNLRNIHTKQEIPKMFGHMVMAQTKDRILKNMTKFQIGTKTGHRAQEHLFTLKSVIALYLSHNLPILIQLYDISKFFDRESLRDGMNALYNCGIRGKMYRLLYTLNKDTVIRVRTAVGETKEAETGENIGQGTLEGAIISAASIDYTVDSFFRYSMDEISYGSVKLQPMLFQDDISRLSTTVQGAQAGNVRMENVMESKLLDFNLDKSCAILMGAKGVKDEMENELKDNPLTLCGQTMKCLPMEKYLGDMICSSGLAGSVHATVVRRRGNVVINILETRAVVDDCRASIVGGITAGLEIWELAILPYLLNNSETWAEMSKATLEMLEKIQQMFYRTILATPRTCPIPALLWETGGLLMEHRIAIKKLTFYHHLINLQCNTLASEVRAIQEAMDYPGLVMEYQNLIEKYELPDIRKFSKIQWKRLVKGKITKQNRLDLLGRIKSGFKKLDYNTLCEEKFEIKDYFKALNLPDARLKFSLRTKMTKTVQMNFKGNPRYAKNGWKCLECDTSDTQDHIVRCRSYQDIRIGKDLNSDKDLVDYFRAVIKMREKAEMF